MIRAKQSTGIATALAGICAVHCALTPLLGALTFLGTAFEHALLTGTAVFWAAGTLLTWPLHRRIGPAIPAAAGFMILTAFHGPLPGIAGAALIAWGGFWNRRLCDCSCRRQN